MYIQDFKIKKPRVFLLCIAVFASVSKEIQNEGTKN